ncbi:MAG: LysM peptidoglycan-binding domain-containing protein [Bacteroidota bacterium]
MMHKWFLVFFSLLCVKLVIAQDNGLQVQGVTPNLYVVHTVQPRENWYSVGRIYNISPKQLAPYNHLSLDKVLSIGQTLKVPLTPENFSQDGQKTNDEVFVPLHHTIQPKEWLYRVSVNYNKVPIENLEKWNHINKDQAKAGLSIIVGYLKVKTSQSALALKGQSKIVVNPIANPTEEKRAEPREEKKIEPKTQQPSLPPVATENAGAAPAANNNTSRKEETKPVIALPVVNANTGSDYKLSYFRTQYEEAGKSISGNAGIFKSTSGWSDGKYYALVNNVAVGTIVKVNNPVSGKTIFAKVLGSLPDMKESIGLVARLSDAGAAQIESTGVKFSVEIRY